MIRTRPNRVEAKAKHGPEWITISSADRPRTQIYTWTTTDGVTTSWDIWTLTEIAERCRVEQRLITREIVQRLVVDGGIEAPHIVRLSKDKRRLRVPGIIVQDAEDNAIIADGSHRFVARAFLKLHTMKFHIVPTEMAKGAELDLDDNDRQFLDGWHVATGQLLAQIQATNRE